MANLAKLHSLADSFNINYGSLEIPCKYLHGLHLKISESLVMPVLRCLFRVQEICDRGMAALDTGIGPGPEFRLSNCDFEWDFIHSNPLYRSLFQAFKVDGFCDLPHEINGVYRAIAQSEISPPSIGN